MQDQKSKLCCRAGALLYDMGNAGDLLKHGVLAEFVRWRCESLGANEQLRFLDPFGGLPFCGDCDEENPAIERFRNLAKAAHGCALAQAHMPNRYYGSSHIARLVGRDKIQVCASDRNESCRKALEESGIPLMDEEKFPGFKIGDSFTILNAEIPRGMETVVLIDPFAQFIRDGKHDQILRQVAHKAKEMAVIFFAPVPKGWEWRQSYTMHRDVHLSGMWTMSCRPIRGGDILGEDKHFAHVVLAAPFLSEADELRERLSTFAGKLAEFLGLSNQDAEMLKPKIIKGINLNSTPAEPK